MKLIANSMLGGIYALAVKLLAAGTAAGLKTEDLFFMKDRELATSLFARLHSPAPITDQTKELYKRATPSTADLDVSAIASLYEKETAKPR